MCFARFEIEHRHGTGAYIRRISTPTVMRDGEHVRFGLACRNAADDLQRFGVDDADGLIEFGGDVQHAVFRPELRTVRPDAMPEIDVPDHFTVGDVNDDHVAAVGPGLAHTGVSVDRHVGSASVRRCGDLMSRRSIFGDFGLLLAGCRINDG